MGRWNEFKVALSATLHHHLQDPLDDPTYAASWKAGGMLPVDVDLPNWAVFHSIFVCPISKEVATPSNPPMMLPCGHALCLSSVAKLARGSRSVRF